MDITRMTRFGFPLAAALFVCAYGLDTQAAVNFSFEVQNHSGGGYSASWLHDADGSGDGANMNGAKTDLDVLGNNELKGTLDGDYLTITEGSIAAKVGALDSYFAGSSSTDNLVIKIIRGGFEFISGTPNLAGGFLQYEITVTDEVGGDGLPSSPVVDTGNFYFEQKNIAGIANTHYSNGNSPLIIGLWGNNWKYTGGDWSFLDDDPPFPSSPDIPDTATRPSNSSGLDWGIDLKLFGTESPGPGEMIPEPGSLLVWSLLGMLAMVYGPGRRRRSSS